MTTLPKTLYIIRGLPGSGKTTLANQLSPNCNVSSDDFMVDEEGRYAHDPRRYPETHKKCEMQVFMWMEQDQPVIAVHNVFSPMKFMDPYVEMAHRYDYDVVILECQSNFLSEHAVLDTALRRMARCWEGPLHLYLERKLGSFKG